MMINWTEPLEYMIVLKKFPNSLYTVERIDIVVLQLMPAGSEKKI